MMNEDFKKSLPWWAFVICLLMGFSFLTGCAINSTLTFYKDEPGHKVSGAVKVRSSNVQEFRSMLEALEYRMSAKEK